MSYGRNSTIEEVKSMGNEDKKHNTESNIKLKEIIKHATGEKKLTKEEQDKLKKMAKDNRNGGVWG